MQTRTARVRRIAFGTPTDDCKKQHDYEIRGASAHIWKLLEDNTNFLFFLFDHLLHHFFFFFFLFFNFFLC